MLDILKMDSNMVGKWKKGEHKKFYTVEDKFRNFE